MRLPGLSIRSAVLAAIAVGVLLPAALVLALDSHLTYRSQIPAIERSRSAMMVLATSMLTEPAWTLSEPGLRDAVERIVDEPSVCAAEVLGLQPAAVPLTLRRDECRTGQAVSHREAPVLHEGLEIARLRVVFDDGEIDRALVERRTTMFLLVAAQVGFGVLVLAAVLSSRLLRPIDRLKRQADALAAREPAAPADWSRDDELGQLGQHLTAVHAQVRGLIDELESKNDELRRLAMHDHLTGLPNRTLLRELFAHAAAPSRREPVPLAMLFIDLDRFKAVNDAHGHAAGDGLLVAVAQRLRHALREADLVCRVGGDEFIVLLQGLEGQAAVAAAAERLLHAVQAPLPLPAAPEPVRVGASIGIAMHPDDGADFDALARAADVAMYRSKELGRGRACFYHPDMDTTLRARRELERELGEALAQEQLRLHFQPVIDARDGRVVGAEALVRWQHPRRGLLGPDAFIEVAEATGLIEPLGRWVLETACAQAAHWAATGRPDLGVAVNVSALQLRDAGFGEHVRQAVQRHGVAPGALTLELTETTLLADGDAVERALASLRSAGVRLAVDDFGTGWSSLAALKLVRPDRVKIDRSFVRDLPGRRDDAALVEAMLGMARALGIEVVPEGVETPAQRDWLLAHGVWLQQGWLWARALSSDAFDAFLVRPVPERSGG